MKSEMTVVEAKQRKKELEETLLLRIKAFEVETGCCIEDVTLFRVKAIGLPPEVQSLEVGCSL